MLNIRFHPGKALEAIIYIASETPNPDVYHVLKILYYADRYHLERFGRLITGDRYIAMKDGPVGSHAYDIIKTASGDGRCTPNGCSETVVRDAFCVNDDRIVPCRHCDEDSFSDSDLECIDRAVGFLGGKSLEEIRTMSQDKAWRSAGSDGEISPESIINELKNSDLILDHLRSGY